MIKNPQNKQHFSLPVQPDIHRGCSSLIRSRRERCVPKAGWDDASNNTVMKIVTKAVGNIVLFYFVFFENMTATVFLSVWTEILFKKSNLKYILINLKRQITSTMCYNIQGDGENAYLRFECFYFRIFYNYHTIMFEIFNLINQLSQFTPNI